MAKNYISYKKFLEIIPSEVNKRLKTSQPNFVLIWGASASGKTTIAKKMMSIIDDSALISIDSYLTESLLEKKFNHTSENPRIPYIEGLDPEIWDLNDLNNDLLDLSLNKSIKLPIYNYSTKKREGYVRQDSKKIVFLEGSYSMNNKISDKAILSILIQADLHDRLIRKIVRTVVINRRNDIDSSIHRYLTQTHPSLNYYFNLYKKRSDFIIKNPLDPVIEFSQFAKKNSLSQSNFKLLIPKKSTGITREKEQLQFDTADNTLAYLIEDRLIFSIEIRLDTYWLLRKYYKVKN